MGKAFSTDLCQSLPINNSSSSKILFLLGKVLTHRINGFTHADRISQLLRCINISKDPINPTLCSVYCGRVLHFWNSRSSSGCCYMTESTQETFCRGSPFTNQIIVVLCAMTHRKKLHYTYSGTAIFLWNAGRQSHPINTDVFLSLMKSNWLLWIYLGVLILTS